MRFFFSGGEFLNVTCHIIWMRIRMYNLSHGWWVAGFHGQVNLGLMLRCFLSQEVTVECGWVHTDFLLTFVFLLVFVGRYHF